MKNTNVLTTAICLLSLTASVLSVSCSENTPVRLRYNAEKKFHHAERALREAQGLEKQLSPGQTQEFSRRFEELVEFCYTALDSIRSDKYPVEFNEMKFLVHQSSTRLSQLYYAARDYSRCVSVLERLIKTAQLDDKPLFMTYINLGQALQAAGDWDSALAVFDYSTETFYPPLDRTGGIAFAIFNLPAHIFGVVSILGDSAAAPYEFNRAENYYMNLIHDYPDGKLAPASRANLAALYEKTGQWEKVLAQLTSLADPSSDGYRNVLLKIADVFAARMKRYDTALAIYDGLLDSADPDDSESRAGLLFKISLVKMDQKEYSKAREILAGIKEDSPGMFASVPLAQYTFARSFELDGRWRSAEQEYSLLIEKYHGSTPAMAALLYLVDHFKEEGREQESNQWYDYAVEYFDGIIAEQSGSALEARALLYKADLYHRQGDWAGAADILLSIFDRFPDSEPGRQAALKASSIYRDKLNNAQAADSLLEMLKAHLARMGQETESQDLFSQ